jgi:DNA-binding NtrC family response regulator
MTPATKVHVLVIDDDANTLAVLSRAFRLAGHEATVCDSAARALELVRGAHFDLIFSDVVMPGKDGLSLLEDLKREGIATPVILISGQANIEMAVRATRLGALDFLEKPISTDKLLVTVENAMKLSRLENENRELRGRLGHRELIWSGHAMQQLMAQIERVAASETRVAILGETGTGKELVARTLHDRSPRHAGPFITLNCAAVPSELIESELFGHEKGSFTGAAGRHIGKFEQAAGGTLFLDEIGDMPLNMQAKLLRVLEEGEIERIGGDRPIRVDVRVIVATHRDLEDAVRRNAFRADLFHRVYVFPIQLPPLRDRREDIPALAAHFAKQVAVQNGWKPKALDAAALDGLARYPWPGNVRELRNVIERLLLVATADPITAADLEQALPGAGGVSAAASGAPVAGGAPASRGTLAERVEAFERALLIEELRRNDHHMTKTAKALGLERSHLYKKCQQLGIDLRALRESE